MTQHESGQAVSGIVASAIIQGRLDASNVSEGRQHKCCCQDGEPPQESSKDIPLAQDGGASTEHSPGVYEPTAQERQPVEDLHAVPAVVLSSAAMAWTQNGTVWIEDAPDESDLFDTETGKPKMSKGEENVNPLFYEEADNNPDGLEAWVQEMEDTLRQQMEDVGT